MDPISFTAPKTLEAYDVVLEYRLRLIGSLPLSAFTTMPMLPWVVAEIKRKSLLRSKDSQPVRPIRLYVSSICIRCEPDPGDNQQWDPLICCSIFEHKPQCVQKLIHNSQDPNYFACLLKEEDGPQRQSTCYVFRAADQGKVSDAVLSLKGLSRTRKRMTVVLQKQRHPFPWIVYGTAAQYHSLQYD